MQEQLASELRLVGGAAEREQLWRLVSEREIGSETARKLVRGLHPAEARHLG